jgi:uncharacterized membrane protein
VARLLVPCVAGHCLASPLAQQRFCVLLIGVVVCLSVFRSLFLLLANRQTSLLQMFLRGRPEHIVLFLLFLSFLLVEGLLDFHQFCLPALGAT